MQPPRISCSSRKFESQIQINSQKEIENKFSFSLVVYVPCKCLFVCVCTYRVTRDAFVCHNCVYDTAFFFHLHFCHSLLIDSQSPHDSTYFDKFFVRFFLLICQTKPNLKQRFSYFNFDALFSSLSFCVFIFEISETEINGRVTVREMAIGWFG